MRERDERAIDDAERRHCAAAMSYAMRHYDEFMSS